MINAETSFYPCNFLVCKLTGFPITIKTNSSVFLNFDPLWPVKGQGLAIDGDIVVYL